MSYCARIANTIITLTIGYRLNVNGHVQMMGAMYHQMITAHGENEEMISNGMVRGLREYFKDYKGCRNCKHQQEPLRMCDYGKSRKQVELVCSGWEKRDD